MRYVIKRDGRKKLFDQSKIFMAIAAAAEASNCYEESLVDKITEIVVHNLTV